MKKLFICLIGVFTFCNIGHTHELADVMQNVLPAVVYITTDRFTMVDHIDATTKKVTKVKMPTRSSQGSGFMISSNIVITNYHVIAFAVENNTKIEITFRNYARYTPKILGYDKIVDIALLEIKGNHPFIKIENDHPLRMGDLIFTISHFYGIGWSGTQGIISSENREHGRFPYIKHLQVQLLQGTGSSGGPLFDKHGHVIGINHSIIPMSKSELNLPKTALMLSEVGYAVHGDILKDVIDRILEEIIVVRVDLGVTLVDFSMNGQFHRAFAPNSFFTGVIILDTDTDSKTTLKELDVILSVDKHTYTDPGKLLNYLDKTYNPGDVINMQVYRNKKIINIAVTLETAEI